MAPTLEVSHISQHQGQDPTGPLLFEKVSFCWQAPSLQVVMGTSGGGKSTFLKSIGGVWKPRTGKITINGKTLWTKGYLQDTSLIRQIGFAFQNNALFNSLRVIENLTFPHRSRFPKVGEKERTTLALDWLAKVGLEQVAYQYPHELSGGMQKRLALARTLAMKPEFVFLDDPTAGLDPITSKLMAELVNELLKGSESLVVIVTNDPDRAKGWGPAIHYLTQKTLVSPGHGDYENIAREYL